jgi:phosphoglycerate dehydrogenase-like enzyme
MTYKIAVTSPSFSENKLLRDEITKHFSEVRFNDSHAPLGKEELADFIHCADGLVVGLDSISGEILEKAPNLKIVAKYGVGLDNIDFVACARHKITVRYPAGVNKRSVAEHTIAKLLLIAHNFHFVNPLLRKGLWQKKGGRQVSNMRLGIIGLGHIGQEVHKLAKPMVDTICYFDIERKLDFEKSSCIEFSELENLVNSCDVVSLHCSLTSSSKGIINSTLLSKFKAESILINTARSDVINFPDLQRDIYDGGQIGAYGVDVYPHEPFVDSQFLDHPKVFATPHIAGNTREAVVAMGFFAIESLVSFFRGDRG